MINSSCFNIRILMIVRIKYYTKPLNRYYSNDWDFRLNIYNT